MGYLTLTHRPTYGRFIYKPYHSALVLVIVCDVLYLYTEKGGDPI